MDNCAKLWFKGIRYELEQVNWHVWWSSYDKKWKARISYLISLIISTLFFKKWASVGSFLLHDDVMIWWTSSVYLIVIIWQKTSQELPILSSLSGNKDHHEFGFSIVRIVIRITVPNVTRNGREVFWSGRVSSSLWSNVSKITSL